MKKIDIQKEFLIREYVNKKKSSYQIAREFGISAPVICRRLVTYEIDRRDAYFYTRGIKRSEAFKKQCAIRSIGKGNPNWRGGTTYQGGYIYELSDGRYQLQHRLVMEKYLGRKLLKSEAVHHRDRNRKNNNIENLELWDRKEHQQMHIKDYWRTIQCNTSLTAR